MNALEKITLEIKAIFLHLPQQELTSLELINFSKGHEGPDMGRGVCVCVCVCDGGGGAVRGQGCQLQNTKLKLPDQNSLAFN